MLLNLAALLFDDTIALIGVIRLGAGLKRTISWQLILLRQFDKEFKKPTYRTELLLGIMAYYISVIGSWKFRKNIDRRVKINGLPSFSERQIVSTFIKLTGSRKADDSKAERTISAMMAFRGMTNAIRLHNNKTTWHHHEVMGVMQLVDSAYHNKYHIGGVAFYRVATNTDYKP